MVLLKAAADGVEEPGAEGALELEIELEVGALDVFELGVGGKVEGAALILVAEAEEDGEVFAGGVVRLNVELVAVRGLVAVGSAVELRLASGGVAVGTADGDDIAEIAGVGAARVEGVGKGEEVAGAAEVGGLLALSGDPVADEVVPAAEGGVFKRCAGVEVLV